MSDKQNLVKKIKNIKQELSVLVELLSLVENNEISLTTLGQKLKMSPQNVNASLNSSFKSYIKKTCKTLNENDIQSILYQIETPAIRLLRDIFEYDSKCLISFPEFNEDIFWSVIQSSISDYYYDIVCKRVGYNSEHKKYTFEQIAADLGISKMRANNVYITALGKLRSPEVINQIFGIEYITKIEQIKNMQKELIDRYNEEYNAYNKMSMCMPDSSKIAASSTSEHVVDDNSKLDVIDVNINELEFSNRTYNCLTASGYTSVSKICNASAIDIVCIEKLGKTCIQEIIQKVDKYANKSSKWNNLKNDLNRLMTNRFC